MTRGRYLEIPGRTLARSAMWPVTFSSGGTHPFVSLLLVIAVVWLCPPGSNSALAGCGDGSDAMQQGNGNDDSSVAKCSALSECMEAASPEVEFDPSDVYNWWASQTAEAVRTSTVMNAGAALQPAPAGRMLDLPVFVMNLAQSRTDRRRHMHKMLSAIGFSDIRFPRTIHWQDLNTTDLAAKGLIDMENFLIKYGQYFPGKDQQHSGILPYIAHAYSHARCMQDALDEELGLFLIIEDNLMPATNYDQTNCRIRNAISQLAPTDDMLYLQLRGENCGGVKRVQGKRHLLRLNDTYCSGAIVYTRNGAEKILNSVLPVWDQIGVMYHSLLSRNGIQAFAANPVAFFQDGKFVSDSQGFGGPVPAHVEVSKLSQQSKTVPDGSICKDMYTEMSDLEMLFVGKVNREGDMRFFTIPGTGMHYATWPELPLGYQVSYYTQSVYGTWNLMAASWKAHAEHRESMVLHISSESVCFLSDAMCQVKMVLQDSHGEEVANKRRILVLTKLSKDAPSESLAAQSRSTLSECGVSDALECDGPVDKCNRLDCETAESLAAFDPNNPFPWFAGQTAEAVRFSAAMNSGSKLSPAAPDRSIDVPVFVVNIAKRPERKRHMEDLLSAIGFTDVRFPPAILWHDLNVTDMALRGELNLDSFLQRYGEYFPAASQGQKYAGILSYVGRAYSQVTCIQEALREGLEMFAIMEDDLMAATNYDQTNCRVRNAMNELSPEDDMLYLEVCYEMCHKTEMIESKRHLLRLHRPVCAGAIVFTRQGAHKVLKEMLPIWDIVDNMLAAFVYSGFVKAYVANPIPFFQDGFFSKESSDGGAFGSPFPTPRNIISLYQGDKHVIRLPLCSNFADLYGQNYYELLFVGIVTQVDDGMLVVIPSMGLHYHLWPVLPSGYKVFYYTKSLDETLELLAGTWEENTVGKWHEDRFVLHIFSQSSCMYSRDSCEITMIVQDALGQDIVSGSRILFLDRRSL